MSRGVIHTATYKDFLGGSFKIAVPEGYKRIQFNMLVAGTEPSMNLGDDGSTTKDKNFPWLVPGIKQDVRQLTALGLPFWVEQKKPFTGGEFAPAPERSLLIKLLVKGINSQTPLVMAAPVGQVLNLGMSGNPYETTAREVEMFLLNEGDLLVNNVGIVLQFTFL